MFFVLCSFFMFFFIFFVLCSLFYVICFIFFFMRIVSCSLFFYITFYLFLFLLYSQNNIFDYILIFTIVLRFISLFYFYFYFFSNFRVFFSHLKFHFLSTRKFFPMFDSRVFFVNFQFF